MWVRIPRNAIPQGHHEAPATINILRGGGDEEFRCRNCESDDVLCTIFDVVGGTVAHFGASSRTMLFVVSRRPAQDRERKRSLQASRNNGWSALREVRGLKSTRKVLRMLRHTRIGPEGSNLE
ncbi:hypothetical protein TNCT_407751 [Trichonephila clavata]|uniref:Uncharacterized protein n=1 Tax=Trichonephila clavata TaxID=2740835 RepID=A0A8X6GZ80_TRICU|nr:hypothetical protein TNCT_407751 [Trichonephila clavata]